MSEIEETKKVLNPYELQKIINQNYKITNDEQTELNNLMAYYANLKANHELDLKELKGKEQDEYQIEYNYNLYSSNYKILIMQKNITYKSFHIKRVGYVRDMMLAKKAKDLDLYKKLFFQFIDKLIEEIISENRLSIEICKMIPHFRNSCINYSYLIYKSIQTEKIKLEMQPVLKSIQDDYNKALKETIENTRIMPNKTDEEIRTIITKKKELLDAKSLKELVSANDKLNRMIDEKNKNSKQDLTYFKMKEMLSELEDYFAKIKQNGSMLDADSTVVRKLEKLEKEIISISKYCEIFSDSEIDKNIVKIIEFQQELEVCMKYQVKKDSNNSNNEVTERMNKILKHNCCSDSFSGTITPGQLSQENGMLLLDDLLVYADLEQKKEVTSKSKSS